MDQQEGREQLIAHKLHKTQASDVSSMSPDELDSYIKDAKNKIDITPSDVVKFNDKYNKLPREFWKDDEVFGVEVFGIDGTATKNQKLQYDEYKHVLITAGSGFSIDSGIPTFEESSDDYTVKIDLLSKAKPHKGYYQLLEFVKDKNYFVFTTNIDDLFRKAGFEKIYECHGNATIIQGNGLPNICYQNKGDQWDSKLYKEQEKAFDMFIDNVRGRKDEGGGKDDKNERLLILELGCGVIVPTIKEFNSDMAVKPNVDLVVINPKHATKGMSVMYSTFNDFISDVLSSAMELKYITIE